MSKRAMNVLSRGLIGLSLLGLGLSTNPGLPVRHVQAEEIDCEDQDNFNDPDCVLKRQQEVSPPVLQTENHSPPLQANNPPAPPAQDPPPAPPPGEEVPVDAPPPPDSQAKQGDPTLIVFQLGDAGKEATQYLSEQKPADNAQWARTRFERGRESAASELGPNVIDTQAWVAKDVDAAKAIYNIQKAIKNFPERTQKERVHGPNDRFKQPENLAEETSAVSAYYQDDDDKTWRHYRYSFRKGKNVGVIYLFGREDLFDDWTPGIDLWLARTYAGRL